MKVKSILRMMTEDDIDCDFGNKLTPTRREDHLAGEELLRRQLKMFIEDVGDLEDD
jgi:hypothetical protein